MYADEGIGVHFVRFIEKNYSFSSSAQELSFVDGGTMANLLIPIMAEFDYLIVVDCLDADDAHLGDVYFFDFEAMPKSVSWSGSAHEIEMLETLQMMDLAGDRPTTKILGVVPKRIEPMKFELSYEVLNSVPLMEKTLLGELANLGFSCQKIANETINDVIRDWERDLF